MPAFSVCMPVCYHGIIRIYDRVKLDTKAYDTYIVYKNREGAIVKEYSNGDIVRMNDQDFQHE